MPRPDSDPTFCSLLDPQGGDAKGGVFAIDLHDVVSGQQSYLRNTAVVETLLEDAAGNQMRLTDFCPRYRERGRIFKPMMYVRIAEPLRGQPRIQMRFRPSEQVRIAPRRSGPPGATICGWWGRIRYFA